MRFHDRLDALGDSEVRPFPREEGRDRDFVGGIHDARQRAAALTGDAGQGEAAERLGVGSGELERTEPGEIERFDRGIPAFGIAQRVLDGYAHVGRAEVRFDRAVGELHHGMDGALRLHDDADAVVGHVEQVVRLDDLEALVHERGRIDRDLRPHVPRGMGERLRGRDFAQLVARAPAERPARSRHPQPLDLAMLFPDQALVNRPVFRIDRHEGTGRPVRRSQTRRTPAFVDGGCQRHDELAAHDERLLVRERKHLARAKRLVARSQPRRAHERVHDDVDLGKVYERRNGIGPESDVDAFGHAIDFRLRPERDITHAELARLRERFGSPPSRSKRHHLQLVRMPARHVERLRPDRARRPKHRNPFHG